MTIPDDSGQQHDSVRRFYIQPVLSPPRERHLPSLKGILVVISSYLDQRKRVVFDLDVDVDVDADVDARAGPRKKKFFFYRRELQQGNGDGVMMSFQIYSR